MDQRGYRAPPAGYENLDGEMNPGQQLALRNSDYQIRGPAAAVQRGPVVSPLQRPRQPVAAAARPVGHHHRRRQTPPPCIVEDYRPSYRQSVADAAVGQPQRAPCMVEDFPPQYQQERLRMAREQSARSVAAPPPSQRKPIPRRSARAPQSVAAPVDSRSSLSSGPETLSSRQKKILEKILADVSRDDSRSSTRKKKAAKKSKKARKGSDSSRRARRGSNRSASKKSVRFEANGSSRSGTNQPVDFARRHESIIARENAKMGGNLYNGYINQNFNQGYFDLTPSQNEPGFLIKVPVEVMLRALEMVDPESFARARGCAERQRQQDQIYHGSSPHAQHPHLDGRCLTAPAAKHEQRVESRRFSVPDETFRRYEDQRSYLLSQGYGPQGDPRQNQNVDKNRSRHGNY